MNFLELVQNAWRKTGQSGNPPASVVGVTGNQLRFVNWICDAWTEIQNESDEWVFLKASAIFSTIANQENYNKLLVAMSDVRIPLAAFILVDTQWVQMELNNSSSSTYEFQRINKSTGSPRVCYYDNGIFSFDSIPDTAYQIKIYYRRNAQELSENLDEPLCDSAYHRTIVWRACEAYARYDEDNALFLEAKEKGEKAMLSMYSDLTPKVTFGRSAF